MFYHIFSLFKRFLRRLIISTYIEIIFSTYFPNSFLYMVSILINEKKKKKYKILSYTSWVSIKLYMSVGVFFAVKFTILKIRKNENVRYDWCFHRNFIKHSTRKTMVNCNVYVNNINRKLSPLDGSEFLIASSIDDDDTTMIESWIMSVVLYIQMETAPVTPTAVGATASTAPTRKTVKLSTDFPIERNVCELLPIQTVCCCATFCTCGIKITASSKGNNV